MNQTHAKEVQRHTETLSLTTENRPPDIATPTYIVRMSVICWTFDPILEEGGTANGVRSVHSGPTNHLKVRLCR